MRQIRAVIFEECSELQKKLPQLESVSPPVTDCCQQWCLITIVSPSLSVPSFAHADNQLFFLGLVSGGEQPGEMLYSKSACVCISGCMYAMSN